MRLIIIDDQREILKKIKSMIQDEICADKIVLIQCNGYEEMKVLFDEEEGYNVNSEEALKELFEQKLQVCKGDRYLLDVTLNEEWQSEREFSEYLSVRHALYIENKGIEDVKIKFYTHPQASSSLDFARETVRWGIPLYRPEMSAVEENAEKQFVEEIKEFCNHV